MASGQEMAAAGGLWLVEYWADREAVVAEVRERGVRALDVFGDVSFLAELPEVEFLVARDPPDVEPIHSLSKLRLLSFPGTWDGRLDGTAWPVLERFGVTEIPKDGGGLSGFGVLGSWTSVRSKRPVSSRCRSRTAERSPASRR
jgi:hypothetical protein